jgi:hypothetical protein
MFAVMDLITSFIYSMIGNGLIMGIVMIGLISFLLLAMRANLAVILSVIIPLIVGLVLNTAHTQFVFIPAWVIIPFFIMAGFLFALLFIYFIR